MIRADRTPSQVPAAEEAPRVAPGPGLLLDVLKDLVVQRWRRANFASGKGFPLEVLRDLAVDPWRANLIFSETAERVQLSCGAILKSGLALGEHRPSLSASSLPA